MLSDRFREAFGFALELHRNQTRKGSAAPYISHLLAVASLVLEHGGDENQAIAALLHDAIEDQGHAWPGGRDGLRQAIGEKFGAEVLAIVNGCTDDEEFPKAAWRARKEAYLLHIHTADPGTRLVSCADKLHNAWRLLADYRRLGEALWDRFRTRSRADQLWYYTELARAFQASNTGPLADELQRVVEDLLRECGASGPDQQTA